MIASAFRESHNAHKLPSYTDSQKFLPQKFPASYTAYL